MAWAETLLVGAGLGLSLAVPPGPVMTQMAVDVSRGRAMRGLLVGLGASTADLAFFLLVWVAADRLQPAPAVLAALGVVGLCLMDALAVAAFRSARLGPSLEPPRLSGFAAGFVLAASSPINLAWWSSAGVAYVSAYGALLGVGFFAAILAWVVASVGLFVLGNRHVPGFRVAVAYLGAGLLACFGFLLAYRSLVLIWG